MSAPVNHTANKNNTIHCLAYGKNCLKELATHIINEQKNQLPDLTRTVVLLPSQQASIQFRKLLLNEATRVGYSALLGPSINDFKNWVLQLSSSELPVLTEHQRELKLVTAIKNHTYLYGKASPWSFADSLLQLFDELSENQILLPEKYDEFLQQLSDAYETKNDLNTKVDMDGLAGEALLVHTLWQAWQQQLKSDNVIDQQTNYVYKLSNSHNLIDPEQKIYIAGYTSFSPAESFWIKLLIKQGKAKLWLHGGTQPGESIDYHPDCIPRNILRILNETIEHPDANNVYGICLNTIYDATSFDLQQRALNFAKNYSTSPVTSRLSVIEAKSTEQEAQAIDLQTRLWWLDGKQKIGIVTENRRLARRVRALLERSGIELQDSAGWALSTTSAAAILERWLEIVEEDFAYQPLLDLLKSPFLQPKDLYSTNNENRNREKLFATIYRFEKSVILKENVGSNLERYRLHTRYRQNRLPTEFADEYDDIYPLLDFIEKAAKPLLPFVNTENTGNTTEKRFTPDKFLDALNESLDILGLKSSFIKDEAGQNILEELQQMRVAASDNSLLMSWTEFRNWLGKTLEYYNFQPDTHGNHVQLMNLSQSSLCEFDALIIASAESDYLPGTLNHSPFFNDGVRQALGLAGQSERLSQRFYLFRCLLESSPHILITRCIERNGENVVCSPWLERIQSFHTIAYNDNLTNSELMGHITNSKSIVTNTIAPLPQKTPANPVVRVDNERTPKIISASGYQQLMDCPYQFFAARCLGLEPPETIREMLKKSDYGERVHLCLHAFHSGYKNLPGPFIQPVTFENREKAIECMNTIAEAVFARDLEDNFLHRGWLSRWQELITPYIDWQIKHQKIWKVKKTEAQVEAELTDIDITLKGRLDRVDFRNIDSGSEEELSIIDYKTGGVANKDDVTSGESIQLPFYALLAEHEYSQPAARVEYLSLDNNKVQSKTQLENENLNELSLLVGQRLNELISSIRSGSTMTAWGDDVACNYCKMSGICRRETWMEE